MFYRLSVGHFYNKAAHRFIKLPVIQLSSLIFQLVQPALMRLS